MNEAYICNINQNNAFEFQWTNLTSSALNSTDVIWSWILIPITNSRVFTVFYIPLVLNQCWDMPLSVLRLLQI